MEKLKILFSKLEKQQTGFIVVTGGVCSSIGKGVLTSSIGVLIKNLGLSVSVVKWDPYLNVDPGTMSPLVHGEVFVTQDGAETDLDLGHYERMVGIELSKDSSVSSGQIFQEILEGEREGKFLGKCIQLVPHVVDAIKNRLLDFALKTKVRFVLVEIGGTVGDIEGEIFLEAVRELHMQLSSHKIFHCHLSYVPYLTWANEIKTKPTQHSAMLLKKAGLVPDAIFLRTERKITPEAFEKVSIMCGVKKELIFEIMTRDPIYKLFLDLRNQQLPKRIQEWFNLKPLKKTSLTDWEKLITLVEKEKKKIKIGLVVKYIGTSDPYISVVEALKAAAYTCERNIEIVTINATTLEKTEKSQSRIEALKQLKSVDGIVSPGGFDKRGVEGKIFAAKWARENKIPYLGLCLGLQVMLMEFARSILELKNASSTELDPNTKEPVIVLLDEQQNIVQKGGTMRLGSFECQIKKKSKAYASYGKEKISERHRHRYELNNAYKKQFEAAGVLFSGINKQLKLVEIAEIKDHPFMIGVQFHPEFLSSPLKPHPLFISLMKAAIVHEKSKK